MILYRVGVVLRFNEGALFPTINSSSAWDNELLRLESIFSRSEVLNEMTDEDIEISSETWLPFTLDEKWQ